ncbi:MAG: aminopeptidase P family protein [Elusimicrobia bacterium]|nr:aminopeptidase P family protein [Elusimicrobiota bacterium]
MITNWLYRRARPAKWNAASLAGLAAGQDLAYACARHVARELQEGWSEAQAARLMDVYLQDHGVRSFFHRSFAWFGERTRFDGFRGLRGFLPSSRRLQAGDCVILDTAPVYQGYPADIGYSCCPQESAALRDGRGFLAALRGVIRELFERASVDSGLSGGDICASVSRHIVAAGYDVIHTRYPGAVLGHRLHPMPEKWRPPTLTPFGWRVYERFLAEGVLPDLLNERHRGGLLGAWAIEPHIGGPGFGCKFEEVLIVEPGQARWLSEEIPW